MENQRSPHQIQIKTLTIDGKKLTKGLFSQLEDYDCLNAELGFKGDEILGFVNAGGKRFLLWTNNGLLRKTNLERYYKVLLASSTTFYENVLWFLRLTGIEFYERSGSTGRLSDLDDVSTFYQKVDDLRTFLRAIKPEMQIFL